MKKKSSSIGIVTLEYHNILLFRMIQWTKYLLFLWFFQLGFLSVTCNGIFVAEGKLFKIVPSKGV